MKLTDIAVEAHAALSQARAIEPYSARDIRLSQDDAYTVAAELRALRGARVVGRKIGFTNRSIWPLYNVSQPIWGDVNEASLLPSNRVKLDRYVEPRLEPEIVLSLSKAPSPDMDEASLMDCIDWVAPGFEVVQSIYPGWRFDVADTIVAGGLHGGLLIGERVAATPTVLAKLPEVRVALSCGGALVEEGVGANALDGPLSALRHLIGVLARDPYNPGLTVGEIVSTGTLTDAAPVKAGESWTARYEGVIGAELSVDFC